MSMLTSSATRNALYNSFKRIDGVDGGKGSDTISGTNSTVAAGRRRSGGASENIGDITAKGEAQIAVVDLLGIASGICLSSKYTVQLCSHGLQQLILLFVVAIQEQSASQ